MKALLFAALMVAVAGAEARTLKVCADPNNLPFSNAREEGFENRIVRLVASELKADVEYVWWAQRRGNVRETLNAGLCDVIPGVASSVDMLATTKPYYRSTYVVVTRNPALRTLDSFDDPRLRNLRLGVQLIGDDGSNTPPAHALSSRGLIANIRGYTVYGDYAQEAPQSPIVAAVAAGELDAAFVWGPTAGYFARRSTVPLSVVPLAQTSDGPSRPMVFDVSMGVRRGNVDLRREVEAALDRKADAIRAILLSYGVPLVQQP